MFNHLLKLAVLSLLTLFVAVAQASQERVNVVPASPKSNDSIQLVFTGQIDGAPIVIDEVVLERLPNLLRLTVSRHGTATGSPYPYSGTVDVGRLPIAHYNVEFYVRDLNYSEYAPPTLAATVSFDVVAQEIPASSNLMLVLLGILICMGGLYVTHENARLFQRHT